MSRQLLHLVVGAGEVGTALGEILDAPVRDIELEEEPERVWMLHISFPYSEGFDDWVRAYRDRYDATVVVVHSTVPVGTCRRLGVCHSPVRGRHPHLAEGMRAHVKFFAGVGAEEASLVFWQRGVATEVVADPESTEAGKLWDLLQYGWSIMLQKRAYAWCRRVGADPDVAYRQMNLAYNAGYQQLGEPQFVRPVLEEQPGRIGGHCVVPNMAFVDDALARLLEDFDAALEENRERLHA